mmetsp:Transcript_19874/g.48290  ORF Transcript_19874/g.48290 Transcript_19874/m.48290 type:complete len:104 (+) Transcript_19874:806-1117(+)
MVRLVPSRSCLRELWPSCRGVQAARFFESATVPTFPVDKSYRGHRFPAALLLCTFWKIFAESGQRRSLQFTCQIFLPWLHNSARVLSTAKCFCHRGRACVLVG